MLTVAAGTELMCCLCTLGRGTGPSNSFTQEPNANGPIAAPERLYRIIPVPPVPPSPPW